ncbi:YHS domain-containing (seleno)protein [Bradyrhizobium lablabi]|uniref:YHS domain-containing (seleno)protein n=1 Tax=Bradyrhizobium lablabi TaxID=722472 RepID=UPI001BAC2A0B|nr:YHS domain-containing (seleno)protein [Bradyrhizobium lablabi]MBR0693572.1 tat pathway signal sequence domain protein [Bradyrhizobium lablabi]
MSKSSKTISRRLASVVVAVSVITLSMLNGGKVYAFDEMSNSVHNVDAKGVGLHGYDPVAYFTVGKPTVGSEKFEATYDSVRYRFANNENREAFVKDPAKYVPAYGGFCAMGTANGKKFDGDPNYWKIVDGKLYVNVNADVDKAWKGDVPGNITKADQNWPEIKNKTPKDLM